jgi:hypothetical protein
MFAGLGGLLVTPAIVRASSLMKLSVPPPISPPWTAWEPWYAPAGLMRGVLDADTLAQLQRYTAARIAQDILSVQPIDPQLVAAAWRMAAPVADHAAGR